MRTARPTFRSVAATMMGAALIASCSTPGGPSAEGDARDTAGTAHAMAAAAPATFFTPTPRVTLDQLAAGKALFAERFRHTATTPLTTTEHEIPWSELERRLPAVPEGHAHGVVFHYGLVAPAFRTAWSYRSVATEADARGLYPVDYTDHNAYERTGDTVTTLEEDAWTWAYQLQPAEESYFSAVEVDRHLPTATEPEWSAVRASDAHSCFLHWERELLAMYTDNKELFAGHEDDVYLVVDCTAELRADPTGATTYIAHTLTTHLRVKVEGSPARDLITNDPEDPAHPWRNRGADYGNLCPSRCAAVELR